MSVAAETAGTIRARRISGCVGGHRRADWRRGAERAAARFRPPRQTGVGADLRRDRRSDCGVRQPAARCCAATLRWPLTWAAMSRRSAAPRAATWASAPRAADALRRLRVRSPTTRAQRRSDAARRTDLQRDDISGRGRPRRRLGRAGRQERHRRHPQQAPAAADERRARAGERPLDRGARAAQVDAGAAAPGGEALRDRPARRRRRARVEQPADERDRLCAVAARTSCYDRGAKCARRRSSPQDLRRIAQESERAARIVRNLLAFARRQAAERAPQDVADLFGRVIALRAYELRLNGIELVTEFEPALPPVVADGSQLQQALLNLMLNAEQAMRGRPTKRLRRRRALRRGRRGGRAVHPGHRPRHRRRQPVAHLRPVLHDPRRRRRHRPRPQHLLRDRARPRRADHGREHGQHGHDVFAAAAGARRGGPSASRSSSRTPNRASAITLPRRWAAGAATWSPRPRAREALTLCRRRAAARGVRRSRRHRGRSAGWQRGARRAPGVPLVLVSMSADDGDVERFGREHASAVLAPPFQLRAIRSAIRAIAKECV